MSHVKHSSSSRRRTNIERRHKKRKLIGILIIVGLFASIIIGIIFISL